jgi:hypothetical protein
MADDLYFGDSSLARRIFVAHAIVTAPVIYSTAAGTGGPLLWNGSKTVNARILAVGYAVTTAAAATGALGLTGAGGQTAAPGSTTAIDSVANLYIGGNPSTPSCTPYRVGTPTNAGTFLLPLAQIATAALTAEPPATTWVRLDRMVTVPPASWVSVAGSATLTTAVMQIGLVWEEVPIP